uniref:MD-2-related lipid-recognition domain-containing protein n=1 Tax=Anopheles christyi TaxID=43041 RepID=A0A182K6P9_9DIPT
MFESNVKIAIYICFIAVLGNVAGLSPRLIPMLTGATVEGSKYMNASVAIHRHGSTQNFSMQLELNVVSTIDDLRMNMGYFVRVRNMENWIYNKTYNFCDFLLRPTIDRFGALVIDELKHRGKVATRCPIQPERFVFENVTLNRIKLPAFLPQTSFGLTVNCYIGPKYEPIFRSVWYGRMRRAMV